jgi:hypothetical protein
VLGEVLGTRITGCTLYTGGHYCPFGRGLIVSEWNRKLHNYLPSGKGALLWVSLDPVARRRFKLIDVVNKVRQSSQYVSIGSNLTYNRVYVGVYTDANAGKLQLGSVMEVVPIDAK